MPLMLKRTNEKIGRNKIEKMMYNLIRNTLHERRQQMLDTTLAIVAVAMFALGWWVGRALQRIGK